MVKLNKTLLDITLYVQAAKKFAHCKSLLLSEGSKWYEFAKDMYFAIPHKLFVEAGIAQNTTNFEKMLDFVITIPMMESEESELCEFDTPFEVPVKTHPQQPRISIAPNKGAYDNHRPFINNCVEDSFG